MAAVLNPRAAHYEFFGPPGALCITLGVPFVAYAVYFFCSEQPGTRSPPSFLHDGTRFIEAVSNMEWWTSHFELESFLIYLAWYGYTVLAWAVLPGQWVRGLKLRDGSQKMYKMNGLNTFLLTIVLAGVVFWLQGPTIFAYMYQHWSSLMAASISMAIAQAVYCYVSSFCGTKLLALGGNSGNVIYDFFIGRELNPSIGYFDIKSFNEVRPGIILWALLNFGMACEQYTRLGSVTDSMILVNLLQLLYVADCLYNEPAILTVMDITTDGFGFMLSIGDLTWVPFMYSLQARFLAFHPVHLGPIYSWIVLLLNGVGYYIFRVSNGEKDAFRKGRNPKNLSYMATERGTKLITSGWWGRSRHPNYMGDLIMALSWSLCTGFYTPITYFYPAYFLVLLVHRQIRDDENCKKKYGKDWDRCTKLVPWRIFPYIY